jgi:hypothetical protein
MFVILKSQCYKTMIVYNVNVNNIEKKKFKFILKENDQLD